MTKLTDVDLRNAFAIYTPKSEWDRFFNEKIDIPDIRDVMIEIQWYRNIIAHYKFLYKNDYIACNRCFTLFNKAILRAIELT